jgi:hypothetical protein
LKDLTLISMRSIEKLPMNILHGLVLDFLSETGCFGPAGGQDLANPENLPDRADLRQT